MDKVLESWLESQHAEALALTAASDVLQLIPEDESRLARRFIAKFDAPTMVRRKTEVERVQGFAVLLQLPLDYLRAPCNVAQIVNVLAPREVFHPNVMWPFVCLGRVAPGTRLMELLYRVYEILTFQKMTPREDDALNADACAWARRNMHLFPLSRAPLRRRTANFAVDDISHHEDIR